MLTQLYTTEEDPALCSIIWGTNFSATPVVSENESNNAITAASTAAQNAAIASNSNDSNDIGIVNGGSGGVIGEGGGYRSEVNAAVAAGAIGVIGDNLRDDLYIRNEDPRTEALREYSYGIILPIICALGIIGNVLNLIVLTRRNMRGTAYIYMRAYSTAALLAIVFAIPFGIRMLVHKDRGQWEEFGPAFYTAHLELFLGNGCLGVGVMMLLILTIERYVSVCHPGFTRPVMGPPGVIVFLTTLITFIIYLPSVFRGELIKCVLQTDGRFVYFRRDNNAFLRTIFYSIYKVMLEVIFKLIPTVLIAGLNLRIMMVYRQTCEKRRKMTSSRASYIKDAEERRLFLLLGSTSILFLVFRALANLLELTNYSITFYIYCLFSEDFRNTLMRTIKWPWIKSQLCHQVDEVSAKQTPLNNFDKLTLRNHHITTTSGVCTGMGRSSSI
ncbi:hypothetical protein DOY81_002789 [Sarcophaga bullata]|nr:hypothetical protein DOY81_002789 [Sarcophaga bullata]